MDKALFSEYSYVAWLYVVHRGPQSEGRSSGVELVSEEGTGHRVLDPARWPCVRWLIIFVIEFD